MSISNIVPVILAGGQGTRLWPASLPHIPKQFIKFETHSLMFLAISRALMVATHEVIIVTGEAYLPIFEELLYSELVAAGLDISRIILIGEPLPKNTAPAIALALQYASVHYEQATMLVITADHLIRPAETFAADVYNAVAIANYKDAGNSNTQSHTETSTTETNTTETHTTENSNNAPPPPPPLHPKGRIVTFGIVPTYPETGYGYIEAGPDITIPDTTIPDQKHPCPTITTSASSAHGKVVRAFKEKPQAALAESYIAQGNYFWNSGMFCFPLVLMQEELHTHCPKLYADIVASPTLRWNAAPSSAPTAHFRAFIPHGINFDDIEKISIDYAVMEHSKHVATIVARFEWNDIGSWDEAATLLHNTDAHYLEASERVLISSDTPVGVVGLSDIIVVVDNNRVLVMKRGQGQGVSKIATADKLH